MWCVTNRQLIVGIDPGTTTALCLFDLEGNIVSIDSGKNLSKSAITSHIKSFGYPVIIASDIYPTPRSIEKTAALFDAKLITPDEKITKKEKNIITKRFVKNANYKKTPWSNRHERDALYAALYAWSRIRPLMRRINSKIAQKNVEKELNECVKRNVILSGKNITNTIDGLVSGKKKTL